MCIRCTNRHLIFPPCQTHNHIIRVSPQNACRTLLWHLWNDKLTIRIHLENFEAGKVNNLFTDATPLRSQTAPESHILAETKRQRKVNSLELFGDSAYALKPDTRFELFAFGLSLFASRCCEGLTVECSGSQPFLQVASAASMQSLARFITWHYCLCVPVCVWDCLCGRAIDSSYTALPFRYF